jgi:7,8-dihydropterin-6-yl-methyl-4-(beta-D-ribofuranosyl)aminobenzene 5'-phosphate synthase
MSEEMNRRDFLKTAAVTGTVLLTADVFQSSAFAQESVKIPEADRITVTIITDNYFETTRPSYKIANRYNGGYIYAEHGLCCHIEPVVDGRSHSFIFDFGPSFAGLSSNMDALKIQLDKVEAFALSHGHQDHCGGLLELLKSRREEMSKGIPFYVGEEAFAERGVGKGPDDVRVAHRPPKKEDLESLGIVKMVEIKDPTPVVSGAYLTGRIEKVTDYEKVDPQRWVKRGDKFATENFIGEQSVVLNLKGKGLVVITGCAHVGVVNTVKCAQKITGIKKVHAILGGFHLTGAKEERIRRTVADIKAMAPDYIMPMHCTGYEALTVFAKEKPDQFILNTTGTRYTM